MAIVVIVVEVSTFVFGETLDRRRRRLRRAQRPAPGAAARAGTVGPERHHPLIVVGCVGIVGRHLGSRSARLYRRTDPGFQVKPATRARNGGVLLGVSRW